jgi:hypothetical protein
MNEVGAVILVVAEALKAQDCPGAVIREAIANRCGSKRKPS